MWLPLAEYSIKHKVSISTLRRRIKAEDIQYKLDDGKYLIFDSETDDSETHRPSLQSDNIGSSILSAAQKAHLFQESNQKSEPANLTNSSRSGVSVSQNQTENKIEGESVLTAANRLLADLKKAYTQVLQEKEEQIVGLKEEISDLRTLVKVLESENLRLSRLQDLQEDFVETRFGREAEY